MYEMKKIDFAALESVDLLKWHVELLVSTNTRSATG